MWHQNYARLWQSKNCLVNSTRNEPPWVYIRIDSLIQCPKAIRWQLGNRLGRRSHQIQKVFWVLQLVHRPVKRVWSTWDGQLAWNKVEKLSRKIQETYRRPIQSCNTGLGCMQDNLKINFGLNAHNERYRAVQINLAPYVVLVFRNHFTMTFSKDYDG